MASSWTLTIRNGPRVEHLHFETLGETVDGLERRIEELAPGARRQALQIARRRYEPARQVTVRAEVTGPGRVFGRVRGGVDLRGDGSAEAYTGRFRRGLVELRAGETPYAGLRRMLEAQAAG
jgi:hypothetical protein